MNCVYWPTDPGTNTSKHRVISGLKTGCDTSAQPSAVGEDVQPGREPSADPRVDKTGVPPGGTEVDGGAPITGAVLLWL